MGETGGGPGHRLFSFGDACKDAGVPTLSGTTGAQKTQELSPTWMPVRSVVSIAGEPLLVVTGAQLMHRLDKGAGVFRIHMLMDAVAKVEDVTGAGTVAFEDGRHLFTDTDR